MKPAKATPRITAGSGAGVNVRNTCPPVRLKEKAPPFVELATCVVMKLIAFGLNVPLNTAPGCKSKTFHE